MALNTGDKFNRLTVIKFHRKIKSGKKNKLYYICKCDCGNTHIASADSLKEERVKSCGCLRVDTNTRHKLSAHPLYRVWYTMKYRCDMPSHKAYKYYGGKGIKYHPDWKNFETFYNWAIKNGWSKGLSFSRFDSQKDYTPENCTFKNPKKQNEGLSNAVIVNVDGVQLPLPKACRIHNKDYNLIRHRLYQGWDFKKAWDTPKKISSLPKEKRLREIINKHQ